MADIFTVLETKINEQINVLEGALYSNRAETLEDYRHMTGQLRGLTVALNLAKDLEKQINNDDWEN